MVAPRAYRYVSVGGRAFTLAELLVVIGVVMIAFGLLTPTLARSMQAAGMADSMRRMQQAAAIVDLYTSDHASTFPLASPSATYSGLQWLDVLADAGYMSRKSEIEPIDARVRPRQFYMSFCMAARPEQFTDTNTTNLSIWVASPVRQDEVVFPSSKGLAFSNQGVFEGRQGWWCCVPARALGVVALSDGSVRNGDWTQFRAADAPAMNSFGIGASVSSTWNGVRGRDE
jgi:type II secretory pathway pseudopilin PulG